MDVQEFSAVMGTAENAGDWDTVRSLMAEDVTVVHPGIGPVAGREANLAVMKFISSALGGYHRTTENLVTDGERGAFRFTITGTHVGDFPGYPATGDPVEIAGAMFFRLEDGLLVEAEEMLNHDSTRGLSLR